MTILSILILSSKIVGYVAIIGSLIIALIAFIITWLVSEFFIPPRDHWSKSGYSIFLVKLGMAGGVAFWVFLFVSHFVIGFLEHNK
jgi:hypothetical protein